MSDTLKNTELLSHKKGDSAYIHKNTSSTKKLLAFASALTLGFAVVEIIGGYLANSLALLSDAGHMVTDSASLLFAFAASVMAQKAASVKYSYGYAKMEVVAALINGIVMFFVVGWIFYEAVERLANPQPVEGGSVFIVASIGLLVNILVAWILSHDSKNLNTRAALLHVMGDLLGSIAAILAGLIIYFGGPIQADPILSMFVSCLILNSSYSIIKKSLRLLLDGVPEDISYEEVGTTLEEVPGVKSVHDLHVWNMDGNEIALSAHVTISDFQKWPEILSIARNQLEAKFGITHVTIQPEEEEHA